MNKTIKDVIEIAIRGGLVFGTEFKSGSVKDMGHKQYSLTDVSGAEYILHISQIALETDFWQALGKELGWDDHSYSKYPWCSREGYHNKMSGMIDHIIDGGNVEEYLIRLVEDYGR